MMLSLVWGASIAALAWFKPLVGPTRIFSILREGQYSPSIGVLAANWARSLSALLLAAAMLFAGHICGVALLRLSRFREGRAGFTDFAAVPIGYCFLSLLFLGLLYARLWFPAILFCSFAAVPLMFLLAGNTRPSFFRDNPVAGIFRNPVALVFLSAFIPWVLVPETNGDAWINGFAAPERWLAMHGLSLQYAEGSMHLPLPAELLYSIPLSLGIPQAAKWFPGAVFLCGVGALLSFQERKSAIWSLIIAGTAAATCNYTTIKGDGFSAGLAILSFGFAFQSMGRPAAGSVGLFWSGICAGLAMSAKYTNILNPLWLLPAVIWVRGMGSPGWLIAWLAAFLAPVLPYASRSYLVTGDPFFPVLSANFPSIMPGWDARNAESARTGYCADKPGWDWPVTMLVEMSRQQPVLLWLLPAWFRTRNRLMRGALFVLLGQLAWYALLPSTHSPRYASISLTILFALSGVVAAEKAGRNILWRACLYLLVLVALVQKVTGCFTATSWNGNPFPYLVGAVSGREHIQGGLKTLQERNDFLMSHKAGGSILLVADGREYQVPKPAYVATIFYTGATPIIWKMVRESRNEVELGRKFRQLNARRISFNPVKAINTTMTHSSFAWGDRELGMYRRFFSRWFEVEFANPAVSIEHGLYYVYRMRNAPVEAAPAGLFCLPGTEGVLADAQKFASLGLMQNAANECEMAGARVPRVWVYMNVQGYLERTLGRQDRAYELYRPSYEAGFLDGNNVSGFALSALSLGKLEEGARALERARRVYPEDSEVYDNYYCRAMLVMADRIAGKDAKKAMRILDGALEPPPPGVRRNHWLKVFGLLHAEKGVLLFRGGDVGAAELEKERATAYFPGLAGKNWKEAGLLLLVDREEVEKLLGLPKPAAGR